MSVPAALASVTSHRELVENLVLRDVKARYKQSILGYAWAIANPLITAVIMWVVGGIFLRQTPGSVPFPLYAYFGILFWNLFATALMTSTESLVSHISLITKVYFPREVFPVSSVLSKVVDFAFGIAGLVILLVIFRVMPSVGILATIPLMLLLVMLSTGIGLLLSCANLFYRDVRYLVGLALGLLVYFVPNFYVLDSTVPANLRPFYLLNPVAVISETARRLAFPSTGPVEPLLPYLGIAAAVSVVTLIVGYRVFKRHEPRFAEHV